MDDYHGTPVADPYRWLEDPDSPETRAFVEAHNASTRAHLDAIEGRDALRARLGELWSYERVSVPRREGDWLYFTRNDGLQDQAVLVRARSMNAPHEVVLDPNTLSDDGTTSLAGWQVSPDGRYLAWGRSEGGSDWRSYRVRDLQTGEDLPDVVHHCKFAGPVWLPDSRSFLYARYPAPEHGVEANLHQRVCLHRLGTSPDDDIVVLSDEEHPRRGFWCELTDDHRYVVATVHEGTDERTRVWLSAVRTDDGRSELGPVVRLLDAFDAEYHYVANDGERFVFQTDLDAPRRRVIAVHVDRPGAHEEVVPEGDDTLVATDAVGDHLFLGLLHHAHSRVRVVDLDGRARGELSLPEVGTVATFTGRRQDREAWFVFTGFTRPTEVHRIDLETDPTRSACAWAPEVPFDPSRFQTRQVFTTSADGTRVPAFVCTDGAPAMDGEQPVLLYGYGGFDHAITPAFDPSVLAWLERGGAWVVANLRGGGEYGASWHEAGTLHHKQNVFDDFVAVAEHLVDSGYTRPARIGIHGRSNGGLLVGATLVQRPDLFGAAAPAVGVLDMLRYHRFTIGWAWARDYGTSEDPALFDVLRAYSPLHNAREAVYPPTLVLTGDHDDRVVPAHSYKFAAQLQHVQQGDAPILLRVDTRAGHGMGKAVRMVLDERADLFAFLAHHLGMSLTG